MASTFSPNLRLELIGAGEQSGAWNNTTNNNLGSLIEQAITGVTEIDVAAGDVTLEADNGAEDQARSMTLILTGTTSTSRNVIAPDVDKVYIVRNQTANSHTIKTASGTGVSVPSGSSALVFCDATGSGVFYNAVEDLAADATVNGVTIATISGSQTLTNKTLTSPRIGTSILDTNGNSLFGLTATSSAVNQFAIANAAAGSSPSITASGSDTNIDLLLVSKGSGSVKADGLEVATVGTNTFTSNQIISVTDNTNAALRITQLGTGEALRVEDSTNPDATPFVVTASGNVGINGATTGAELTVSGTQQNRLWMDAFGVTNRHLFVRANGTASAKTIVASGDSVGSVNFFGYDGANNIELANITAAVDGTPGLTDVPGRLIFSTSTDASPSVLTERFRIGNAGQLGIAGANYGTAGQTLVSGGSSAAPSWGSPAALSTASGSAPSYSARAWVCFNGTGTVSIKASANVSSITDNATGTYTANFTTSMPDANYAWSGSGKDNDGFGDALVGAYSTSVKTTSALQFKVVNSDANAFDSPEVCIIVVR